MNTSVTQLLHGIDTVIIRVSDIDTSRLWYHEKLGLTPIWDDASIKLVVLNTNGPTSLTLWQTEKEKIMINKETASYPIFSTSNAIELRQELINKEVSVEDVILEDFVKYFFFFDPVAMYWKLVRFIIILTLNFELKLTIFQNKNWKQRLE